MEFRFWLLTHPYWWLRQCESSQRSIFVFTWKFGTLNLTHQLHRTSADSADSSANPQKTCSSSRGRLCWQPSRLALPTDAGAWHGDTSCQIVQVCTLTAVMSMERTEGQWEAKHAVQQATMFIITIITQLPIGEQSIVMSMSVCWRVCLSVCDHIFGTTCPIFTMYMLPMAVAWSSSGGVRAQQYVTYFQFSEWHHICT